MVVLALVVSTVIIISAIVSTLAVRSYLNDRVSSRLVASAARTRASLVDLHSVLIDSSAVADMSRAESSAVVLEYGGQPSWWVNTDEATARALLATDLSKGEPKPVTGRPGLIAIKLDTVGSGLQVRVGGRLLRPDGVIIAYNATDDLATFQTLVLVNAAVVLMTIALLVVLTVLIVDRGIRPLRTMAGDARKFADGDRSWRLAVASDDPDITRLAATINEAFDAQQRAESRLRAFVADASHELRTPLTIATGWIELYVQGGLGTPELLDRAVQRVQTQLGRMRVLVDELTLLARLDHQRPLDADPVDLTALTAEVVEDARIMNPDREFSLTADGPAGLLGDAPRLQQVLVNLIGNAAQHTPAGTAIDVTVIPGRLVPGNPAHHTLLVTDHGPGIASQDQPHVFERFWRGNASHDGHTGGSGLGLSIVASIVAAHGGSSHVSSSVGKGTTVRIILPVSGSPRRAGAGRE